MSGVALYEIADMRDVLETWLTESEGEVTPELESLMAELDGKADEKIERVALYVRERLARAAAVKEEVQRLASIQKREERAAESLKAYLHRQMDALGKTKVAGLLCAVALQSNPPSVQGDVDAAALWDVHTGDERGTWRLFIKYIPESFVLDRWAVIEAHKSGQPIPDGLTVTQTQSLRIR